MGHPVATPPASGGHRPAPEDQLLVRVAADGRIFLDRQEIPPTALAARLHRLTAERGRKMVFFAADGGLPYGDVAELMDMVRNNGGGNLGIVFDDLRQAGT
jgi:biopolymer transport protein TolR